MHSDGLFFSMSVLTLHTRYSALQQGVLHGYGNKYIKNDHNYYCIHKIIISRINKCLSLSLGLISRLVLGIAAWYPMEIYRNCKCAFCIRFHSFIVS